MHACSLAAAAAYQRAVHAAALRRLAGLLGARIAGMAGKTGGLGRSPAESPALGRRFCDAIFLSVDK